VKQLTEDELADALRIADLTEPQYNHAISQLVELAQQSLTRHRGWPEPTIVRQSPVTTIASCYDRLLFDDNSATRSDRYTRYIDDTRILRGHTGAMIPDMLDETLANGATPATIMAVGLCFRNASLRGALYNSEPHQCDIWRIGDRLFCNSNEQMRLAQIVAGSTLPGQSPKFVRMTDEMLRRHPYLSEGYKVRLPLNGSLTTCMEVGCVSRRLFDSFGFSSSFNGIALGIMLDRLLMIRKGIPDIKLIRSTDPRVQTQMYDLEPFVEVSKFPSVVRDISVSVPCSKTIQEIETGIRANFDRNDELEGVELVSETNLDDLPAEAVARLGIQRNQKNVLLRLTFRSHKRTLTGAEANSLRNQIHRIADEGESEGYLSFASPGS